MVTEAAKVIIDAEDRASAKVMQSAANIDASVKRIRDVGGKAKASTEFIGTLSNSLGGTALGSYAGQLAQITERISAFSEVSRSGSAGALAFKAGLVAVAGVITYQVSTAIAELVFQTKEAETALRNALQGTADAMSRLRSSQQRAFSNAVEDLNLKEGLSGFDSRPEFLKMLDDVRDQIRRTGEEIARSKQDIADYEAQWIKLDKAERIAMEAEKDRLGALQANMAQLESQQDILRDELSGRNAANDAIREQIKLEDEQRRAQERRQQDAEQELERIVKLRQSELDKLALQRIELEQGSAAAKAYALELQGLDALTAAKIAAEQERLDTLKQSLPDPGIQAFESRTLTRGPSESRHLKAAEKAAKELEEINKKLPLTSGSAKLEVEIVG